MNSGQPNELEDEGILDDPIYGPFVMEVLQSVSESLISNGDIDATGKSESEILHEAARYILDNPDFFEEWKATASHEGTLLLEGRRYVANGHRDLAIMMFATWIEHRLNWLLMSEARRRGFSLRESAQMIREMNMPQKTGTSWRLLFGESLDAQTAKDISDVAGRRNNFVHYKWPEGHIDDGPPGRDELPELLAAAERVVESLDQMYGNQVYGGRDSSSLPEDERQARGGEGAAEPPS